MQKSKLWSFLAKQTFSDIDETFIRNFREPGNANNRLAAWDPLDKSMRYFKFLLFNQLKNKNDQFFSDYKKIGETNLGNPVVIHSKRSTKINLDHFLSIEEYHFLKKHLDFNKVRNIIEIGAGFGRTAQALIKLEKNIKKYTIIDIPEVLTLSKTYLKKVLNKKEFSKVVFTNAYSSNVILNPAESCELVINVDSFQEMHHETVRFYIKEFCDKAVYFYTKNTVAKYKPSTVGIKIRSKKQIMDVFSLGLSTDVIDIFNERELIIARKKHVQQYLPSSSFKVIGEEPLGIFPYYLNVLYAKKV